MTRARGLLTGLGPALLLTACTGEGEPEVKTLPEVTLVGFDSEERVDPSTLKGPLLGINDQETQRGDAEKLISQSRVTYDLLSDPEGELNRSSPFPFLQALPFLAPVETYPDVTL